MRGRGGRGGMKKEDELWTKEQQVQVQNHKSSRREMKTCKLMGQPGDKTRTQTSKQSYREANRHWRIPRANKYSTEGQPDRQREQHRRTQTVPTTFSFFRAQNYCMRLSKNNKCKFTINQHHIKKVNITRLDNGVNTRLCVNTFCGVVTSCVRDTRVRPMTV